MSTWLPFFPVFILVAGAIAVLLLENSGAPPGFRKSGSRIYLGVISMTIAGASLLQAWSLPMGVDPSVPFTLLHVDALCLCLCTVAGGTGLIIAAAAVPALKEFQAHRGEVFALLLFGLAAWWTMISSSDLLALLCCEVVLLVINAVFLVIDRRTGRGSEAAMKSLIAAWVWLCLFSMGLALSFSSGGGLEVTAIIDGVMTGNLGARGLGAALLAAAVFMRMGVPPFSTSAVDAAHAGGSFAISFHRCGSLLVWSSVLLRLAMTPEVPSIFFQTLVCVGAIGMILPALAALDQRDLDRVFGYLMVLQSGVLVSLIACVSIAHDFVGNAVTGLVGCIAAILGIAVSRGFVLRGGKHLPTWERWAGVGREHPLFGIAMLVCGASLAGMPGTPGFWARIEIVHFALQHGKPWLAIPSLLSAGLAGLVILRLGFFLFGKSPDPRRVRLTVNAWRAALLTLLTLLTLGLGIGSSAVANILKVFCLPLG